MKKNIVVLLVLWRIFGICYYPIYLLFCLLHWMARLLLAISYFGKFEKQKAKDIFKSLFIITKRP